MKTAVVFPGQGSQSAGMLSAYQEDHADTVERLLALAQSVLGYDLAAIIQDNPDNALGQTIHAQPAMLVTDLLVWALLPNTIKEAVACVAGHSLGEYAALVVADVLSPADALRLVAVRAQAMQDAVPLGQGAMAAVIGMAAETLQAICTASSDATAQVSLANINSPQQIVLAGHAAAVERAMRACKEQGAKRVVPLPVSVPSHCALMKPAVAVVQATLDQMVFADARIPVITNVHARPETSGEVLKQALLQQLDHAVQWVASVQSMQSMGIERVIECGPGRVLTGLNKRIDRTLVCASTDSSAALQAL